MRKTLLLILFAAGLCITVNAQSILHAQSYHYIISSIAGCVVGQTYEYGDSIGTTDYSTKSTGYIYYYKITVECSGQVDLIGMHIGTASVNVKFALYAGATQPDALVTNSETSPISSTVGWNTVAYSTKPTVTANTVYWVAMLCESNINQDNSGGTGIVYYGNMSYASGFPATVGYGSPQYTTVLGTDRDFNTYIKITH